MKLAELTWKDVAGLDREVVVLIPTGALEQHGPHLPLFTDSIMVTAVAEAIERALPDRVVLTPTLWLGASLHHLGFPGSLSASFDGYDAALAAVIESLQPHGFRRFFVVNGHGGNTSPNDVTLRRLKAAYPNLQLARIDYWSGVSGVVKDTLAGQSKEIRHADEGETSLMLHVRPDLVRTDKARVDGLIAENGARGTVYSFSEITEEGVMGYATMASAAKGKVIFEAAVADCIEQVSRFAGPQVLVGQDQPG
jgi:creatinine amidohydrolase